MKPFIKISLCTLILSLASFYAIAQDKHFVQYQAFPLYNNPALAGVTTADIRVAAIYRNQWLSVPVAYQTFGVSADFKLLPQLSENGILALGINLYHDFAGDSNLSWTEGAISLAYTQRLQEKHWLSLGFQAGGIQRAFDRQDLTFDAQFNGDVFDPNATTLEDFTSTRSLFASMGAGANYHFQYSKRTFFHVGTALHHLNRPSTAFDDNDKIEISRRSSTYLRASIKLSPTTDWVARGIFHYQNPYRELLFNTGIRYHFNTQKGQEVALSLLGGYRLGDAAIAELGIDYRQWYLGLSYDVNLSDFKVATQRRGGSELSLIYSFTKVKPILPERDCPVF